MKRKSSNSCQVIDDILALLNAEDGDIITFGGKAYTVKVCRASKKKTVYKRTKKQKYPNLPCFKGIATEKSSYKVTTKLLKELLENGKETGQIPVLEIRLKDIEDKCYYKLECKVSKE